MRKSTVLTIILTLFYSLILGYICYQVGTMNPRDKKIAQMSETVQAETITPSSSPSPSKLSSFIIKEYNNKIGVYENDELIRIVDINISSLREEDVKLLQEGITTNSKQDALQMIEDFSS